MMKRFLSLFRRRRQPVVVRTFKVAKDGDWIKLHFEKHRQLAKELGKPWPEQPHANDR